MPNVGVRLVLTEWGRWARTGMPGKLPSMSTTEKARMGRGGAGESEPPPHILEVNHLVNTTPSPERMTLVVFYSQHGSIPEKAHRLGISRWTFRRRLERAESYIAYQL